MRGAPWEECQDERSSVGGMTGWEEFCGRDPRRADFLLRDPI